MTITHDNTLNNKQKDMGTYQSPKQIENSIKEKHQELKRLQLEINEAMQVHEDLGFVFAIGEANEEEEEAYDKAHETIESNTARIAEIILNEL